MGEEEIQVSESVEAVLARLDERTEQMQKRFDERFDSLEKRLDDMNVSAIKGGAASGTAVSIAVAAIQYMLGIGGNHS